MGESMYKGMLLAGCLLTANMVYAVQENLNNIWLSYSQDANDTTSKAALLTLGLGADDQLILGVAQTDSQYTSQTLTSNDYSLTYSTLRLSPWSLDLGYDYWGKDQELEIRTFNLAPLWHGQLWSLGLNLEQRKVTFYSRQFISGQYSRDVDSTGIGPEIDLLAGNWSWSLTGMRYSYSKDFSNLNLTRVLLLLGARTFLHTTTLTDWYATTQLKYDFSKFALGATYSHSISALDQQATDSVSGLLDLKFSKAVSVELEAGRVYTPNAETTDFANAGLSIDF
jgi:hypothetical protein